MQAYRDIAMVALGAVGVLAYQRYREPVMKKMDCVMDSAIDKATNKLEKMK